MSSRFKVPSSGLRVLGSKFRVPGSGFRVQSSRFKVPSFRFLLAIGYCLLAMAPASCRRDMFDQPKSNPLRESDLFPDRAASRPIPAHTIPRERLNDDSFYTGLNGTNPVTSFPYPITRAVLAHGQQRFEINCAPCHGLAGEGNGIIVHRGFPAPPSYHIDRLRDAPAGHFVDVMTHGYGAMLPQAERVAPEDRWAIAAYIRALQLSQHATMADAPADQTIKLQTSP